MRNPPVLMLVGAALVLACTTMPTSIESQTTGDNALSTAERQAGWQLLFDGRVIDKWRGYGTQTVPSGWVAADGAMTRLRPASDLSSVDEFTNFEFALDWKIAPAGNSGIMFRVTEGSDPPYYTGPELQILDNAGHADGKAPETSAGSNYALHAPTRDATKPVGQWNRVRLLVDGTHVEHWLNGEKVVEYELGSADWTARVARSKFSAWPGYGKAPRGRLVLQDHGDVVSFKNLKVRRIE